METFNLDKYEQEKHERRQLRGRQTGLRRRFLKKVSSLSSDDWVHFAVQFQENLQNDIRLDPFWIDTDRYLIAIYNLFHSLGFKLYYGPLPRVSGIDPDYHFPLLAYDQNRAILIENNPTYLFADLADMQPRTPVPIIGLSYNGIATSVGRKGFNYAIDSLKRSRSIAGALALGHLTISVDTLRDAIALNPFKETRQLKRLAKQIGLIDFLRPPVDTIPVFGQQASANHDLAYSLEQFLRDASKTTSTGTEISTGDVTQATANEALADPDYYFRELNKARLLKIGKHGELSATFQGSAYLRSRILPFPLGQLLYHTCLAAREEVQNAAKSAFLEAFHQGRIESSSNTLPLFVSVDDIDSFSAISFFPANSINAKLPLKYSEEDIKQLLHKIIGDPLIKRDWGGEQNDIFSSRVIWNGRRLLTAFFLKGPSVKGRLTLAKCGKNGDQIQRLFQSPADMFVVQFNGEIDERVIEECRQKVRYLRQTQNESAFFTIIDGVDTARLLKAYKMETSI